jgi:hypothetical protein
VRVKLPVDVAAYRLAHARTLTHTPSHVNAFAAFIYMYGGRWQQLVHQYPVTNGHPTHQFATGGYGQNSDDTDVFNPWVFGGLVDPAYTNNVTYADGSVQTLNRRERPKLLFTSDGRTFLYNAAQSPLNASRDFSFTLVQEVLGQPAH